MTDEEDRGKVFLYNGLIDISRGLGISPKYRDCAMFHVREPAGQPVKGGLKGGMASPETIRTVISQGYSLVLDTSPSGERKPLTPNQRKEYSSVIGM